MSDHEAEVNESQQSVVNLDGQSSGENDVGAESVESVAKIKGYDEPKSTEVHYSEDETEAKQTDNDDPENTSHESNTANDICRICHMGETISFSQSLDKDFLSNNNDSNNNLQNNLNYQELISACNCRGTVGRVHRECLERWLTESGHTRCELCGHEYATKSVLRYTIARSFAVWFNTVIVTRQVFLDIMYLLVTTPLAAFSCYVCTTAIKLLFDSGLKEIPWSIVAMIPTCSVTLFAYWGWLVTLSRLHGRRWRRYWRYNYVIRLDTSADQSTTYPSQNEDFEDTLNVS